MVYPKIVHMTSAHDPEDNRIFKQCRSLANMGFSVTFIAPGRQDQVVNDVLIKAISPARRRLSRMTRAVWSAYREARRQKGDIYHFHDPELIPVALLLRLTGKKVVFDVHENVSEQMARKEWIPEILRTVAIWIYNFIERNSARLLSAIVTANEDINHRFSHIRAPVVTIHNYADLKEFAVDNASINSRQNSTLVIHTGGIDSRTSIQPIVDAFNLLAPQLHATLVITGPVDPVRTAEQGGSRDHNLWESLQRMPGWQAVDYRGTVSRSEMIALIKAARAALVLYDHHLNHRSIRSNRFYEALAAGLPVVVPHFVEWKECIDDFKCGLTVDPQNAAEIARAIDFLLTHPLECSQMGEHARRAASQCFSWETEEQKMKELYLELRPKQAFGDAYELTSASGRSFERQRPWR